MLAFGNVVFVFAFLHTAAAASLGAEYGVVIDAGSSGSRVHVYTWSPRSQPDELPTDVREVYNFKVKPGLSSFEDDLISIQGYVKDLVSRATENVPRDSWSDTPIFLLATAGMRLIPEEKATAMMNVVDDTLSNPDVNPFIFSPSSARILSGEEEGVFAWIDINYNMGFLHGAVPTSVGLLEMGGASAQIAFLPEGDPLANMFPVTLNGVDYKLYAHSYLGYGQDYVKQWEVQFLWQRQGKGSTVNNPCMFQGDQETMTLDMEGSPEVLVLGTSDSRGCEEVTNYFVYEVNPLYCHPEPCAIGPVYQPPIPPDMMFYAVSAFVFPLSDLNAMFGGVFDANGFVTPQGVLNGARQACSLDYNTAIAKSTEGPEFARNVCEVTMYFGTLLSKGYNFDQQSTNIKTVTDVNEKEIAWTSGALLYGLAQ